MSRPLSECIHAIMISSWLFIQGVTYCGDSGASSLRIDNVPFHKDVVAFGQVSVFLRCAACHEAEFSTCSGDLCSERRGV